MAIETIQEYLFDQGRTFVQGQPFEDAVFFPCQMYGLATPLEPLLDGVDPGNRLALFERFYKIVVSSETEAFDLVVGLGAMVADQRGEVVSLGVKLIVVGTLATCITVAIVGIL